MKLTTIAATVFCISGGLYARADDAYGNHKLERIGESVQVSSITTVTHKRTLYDQAPDVTLHRINISQSESSPPSYMVSGRIISANTLGPADSVFIFVGRNDDQPPRLAAMSNDDGEFKFRLWIHPDPKRVRVGVPDDFSGYLYVDGKPVVGERGRITLVSGKSRRYALSELVNYSNASSSPKNNSGIRK